MNASRENLCGGHESLDGAHTGEAVYCDGSCRQRSITGKPCGCGCGEQVLRIGATFRPGHDAKLVAKLVLRTVEDDNVTFLDKTDIRGWDIQEKINHVGDIVEKQFSKALAVKYTNAAMNAWTKATGDKHDRRATRAARGLRAAINRPEQRGVVKVGRWDYPARRFADTDIERNTKRDGSGEWVRVATLAQSATFRAS